MRQKINSKLEDEEIDNLIKSIPQSNFHHMSHFSFQCPQTYTHTHVRIYPDEDEESGGERKMGGREREKDKKKAHV